MSKQKPKTRFPSREKKYIQKRTVIPSSKHATIDSSFIAKLKNLSKPFDFFIKILPNIGGRPLKSDVVELRHCDLSKIDYGNYTVWASTILNDAWPKFEAKLKAKTSEVLDLNQNTWEKSMVPEFALGLLEVYATHSGHCDFSKFPLQIAYDLRSQASMLNAISPAPKKFLRLVIVIVAFKDSKHLSRIIRAVHMPHHYIIIHLERLTPSNYVKDVEKIASQYNNVVVVQFGTVTYRTDSVSFVNYQIMNWITNNLGLEYDYYLTLGGAVYPLFNAEDLLIHLERTKRDVWLGELTHGGNLLVDGNTDQHHYLMRKRLIYTSGKRKYQQRTKKYLNNGFIPNIPGYIQRNMTKKTNSGNQGVFSKKFVKELTNSPEVKELFATAKYGCCCCLEERTWIAAASIIGYQKQALARASIFQVWGGKETCGSSMNNAVLGVNASICFRNEDATEGSVYLEKNHVGGDAVYFKGNETISILRKAKNRGFMFARKFSSEDSNSMKLLDLIEEKFHKK